MREKKCFLKILIYNREGERFAHIRFREYTSQPFRERNFLFRRKYSLEFLSVLRKDTFFYGNRDVYLVAGEVAYPLVYFHNKHLRKGLRDGGLELPKGNVVKGTPFTLASYTRYPFAHKSLVSVRAYVF